MAEPIPFTVTRYRCPSCSRTGSSKTRIADHMTRCWRDPANRGCKTCDAFMPFQPAGCDGPEEPEHCLQGLALPVVERDWGETTMPMLHCELWAAARAGQDGQP